MIQKLLRKFIYLQIIVSTIQFISSIISWGTLGQSQTIDASLFVPIIWLILLFNILKNRNWARRAYLAIYAICIIFIPFFVYALELTPIANIIPIVSFVLTSLIVVFLLNPTIRSSFINKEVKKSERLSFYITWALSGILGILILFYQNSALNTLYSHLEKERQRTEELINLKLPKWGFFGKYINDTEIPWLYFSTKQGHNIILMFPVNKDLTYNEALDHLSKNYPGVELETLKITSSKPYPLSRNINGKAELVKFIDKDVGKGARVQFTLKERKLILISSAQPWNEAEFNEFVEVLIDLNVTN